MRYRFAPLAVLTLPVVTFAVPAQAAWPTTTTVDVPVATVDSSQVPSVVADSAGGAYVIFSHSDSTASKTLRGEHFDAQGNRLWSTATDASGYVGKDLLGLPIGTGQFGFAQAVSDTAGGVIAGYTPGLNGGPYTLSVQRFDSAATASWAPTGTFGGVQLLATPYYYNGFWMIQDGAGGALLDEIGATSGGVVGQRVNGSGALQYGAGYVFTGSQYPGPFYPTIFVSNDGQGGMYFIFADNGSATTDPLIDYLTPTGAVSFTVPSVAPANTSFEQWTISGLPSGAGAWASWYQYNPSGPGAVLLQRFTSTGTSGLDGGADNGIRAGTVTTETPSPQLISDGTGGVVDVWFDVTAGVSVIYAQRFGADGTPKWGASPVLVSGAATTPATPSGYLSSFRVVPTDDANVAIFWVGTPNGIFAEKLDMASGTKKWGPLSGGIQVTAAASPAWVDATFASDDSAYVAFQLGNDIYIKHVEPNGSLGTTPTGTDGGVGHDGGVHDGGVGDGGVHDGGVGVEASVTHDAGVDATQAADTGVGHADAQVLADSGHDAKAPSRDGGEVRTGSDGSVSPDAGGAVGTSSGCGCRIQGAVRTNSASRAGLLGLVALVVGRRRWRRRAAR
jgi:hypothetical protein